MSYLKVIVYALLILAASAAQAKENYYFKGQSYPTKGAAEAALRQYIQDNNLGDYFQEVAGTETRSVCVGSSICDSPVRF